MDSYDYSLRHVSGVGLDDSGLNQGHHNVPLPEERSLGIVDGREGGLGGAVEAEAAGGTGEESTECVEG